MAGFLDPLWLVALVVLPLIRWLHRWQVPLSTWPVSAIFLWNAVTASDAGGTKKTTPDPAWRRRALAVTLLIITLANPYWKSEERSLTVWVDDSLSMFTKENGRARLDTLLQTLAKELESSDPAYADIELRSLTDAGKAQPFTAQAALRADNWSPEQATEPAGPPPASMAQARRHWLLSDGASESVRGWIQLAGVDRILQTGIATENSAITSLSARRSLAEDNALDVLVAISNTGNEADTRQLELRSDQTVLQATTLALKPGTTIYWQTRVAITEKPLTAAMLPTDFLALDDSLTLRLDSFMPLSTFVSNACATALRQALASHPALRVSSETADTALQVRCVDDISTDEPVAGAAPLVRVLLAPSRPVDATPSWFTNDRLQHDFTLRKDWISASAWPENGLANAHRVVLAVDGKPLVVLRQSASSVAASVDTVIDLSQANFTRQPEYAAFVSVLVDLATQRRLLDETVSATRSLQASTIAPALMDAGVKNRAATAHIRATPLSTAFLFAALLTVLLDAALLLRSRPGVRFA